MGAPFRALFEFLCKFCVIFAYLYVIAASPWPTAEPAHAQQNEQALLPSLNRSLDEDTFHPLTVNTSSIERVLDLRSSLLTLG